MLATISVVSAAGGVVLAVAHVHRWRVLDGLAPDVSAAVLADEIRLADSLVDYASVFFFGLAIAEFVMLVVWTWRMAVNCRLVDLPPRMSNGLAIGGYFIPIANIIIPFLFFRDFVSALAVHARVSQNRYTVMIWWWWLQVGALFFAGSVDEKLSPATIGDYVAADRSITVGRLIFAVSAVLGALTFRRFAEDAFTDN